MREGSGRGLGRVGSDFSSAIAGPSQRFAGSGRGPRKVTGGQLCRGQIWTPMGSLQRSQRHILYSWIWLGSKCGMCLFSANSSIRHWGKIKMFAWKVELYTRLHGFKDEFSKLSGEGLPKPSPQIPPPLNFGLRFWFGLRPQISGASCPRFGLYPQFTPNMFDHFPKQGKLQIKYFTPLLLGYATVFYNSILQIVICCWAAWAAGPPNISDKSAPMGVNENLKGVERPPTNQLNTATNPAQLKITV